MPPPVQSEGKEHRRPGSSLGRLVGVGRQGRVHLAWARAQGSIPSARQRGPCVAPCGPGGSGVQGPRTLRRLGGDHGTVMRCVQKHSQGFQEEEDFPVLSMVPHETPGTPFKGLFVYYSICDLTGQ